MRVAVDSSAGDIGRLNWIKFTQTGAQAPQTPFNGAISLPGVIEVENFDNGGQGVAYNDLSGANEGNSTYRAESVDLEISGDTGGGVNVGYAQPGEWLEYTVSVATAGTYTLGVRVASMGAGGTFHIELDGQNVTGSIAVTDTGGWQTYQTITKAGLTLPAGQHVLRLAFDSAGGSGFVGNFNYLQFTTATTPTNQPPAVNAGADQVIVLPATAALSGTASDDGLPTGNTLSTTWTRVSGAGTVTFGNAAARSTTAAFSAAGTYVLRLTASDGSLSASDDITIVVNAAAVTPTTYNPTADTYAQDGGTAGTNYGTAKTLIVKRSNNAGSSREALFKFDLTSFAGTARERETAPQRLPPGHARAERPDRRLFDLHDLDRDCPELEQPPGRGDEAWDDYRQEHDGAVLRAGRHPLHPAGTGGRRKVVSFLLRNPNTSQPYSALPRASRRRTSPNSSSRRRRARRPTRRPWQALDPTRPSRFPRQPLSTPPSPMTGCPNGSNIVTSWTKVSGPGTVTFANAGAIDTTATFSTAGTYVLRLGASDGLLSATDDVTVIVSAAPSGGQSPFGGTPIALPGRIEAENFDNGGRGVAYADADTGNRGGVYRIGADVDVDVELADDGGGYNVGWIRAGEWLEYTVNVAATGTYNLDVRVASGNPGGTFHVEVDAQNVTGAMNLFSTGGWSNWQTISKTGVSLTAGTHVVRLSFDSTFAGDIGRVNWIQFGTAVAAPAAGQVWTQQSVLAAENGGVATGEESAPPFVGPTHPSYTPGDGLFAPAAAVLPSVTSFTVIDADSDQPIAGMLMLTSGETIDLAKTPSKRINIRANTSPSIIGSVRFGFDGNPNYRVESSAPYALASDANGDFNAWTPSVGSHALNATPYTSAGAIGSAGATLSILFNVIDSSAGGGETGVQQPYNGVVAAVPGTIQAENFDNGGEGVAYHDADAAQPGRAVPQCRRRCRIHE
jgi:hypothetical protein